MKITNEQLLALQQSETLRKKQTVSQDFEALLEEQLPQTQGTTGTARPMTNSLFMATENVDEAALINADLISMDMQSAAVRIDSLFSDMEKYAKELGSSSDDSLKKAYGFLQNMPSQIANLRAAYPTMDTENPELAVMINELDVITTTETFKFNRGDYL